MNAQQEFRIGYVWLYSTICTENRDTMWDSQKCYTILLHSIIILSLYYYIHVYCVILYYILIIIILYYYNIFIIMLFQYYIKLLLLLLLCVNSEISSIISFALVHVLKYTLVLNILDK